MIVYIITLFISFYLVIMRINWISSRIIAYKEVNPNVSDIISLLTFSDVFLINTYIIIFIDIIFGILLGFCGVGKTIKSVRKKSSAAREEREEQARSDDERNLEAQIELAGDNDNEKTSDEPKVDRVKSESSDEINDAAPAAIAPSAPKDDQPKDDSDIYTNDV